MIFKKGDKVYDHAYGWGEVEEIDLEARLSYQLKVDFKKEKGTYTTDGKEFGDSPPTLSFTEYTLEGFSQVRPKEPLPFKVGDVVYMGTKAFDHWTSCILKGIVKGNKYCFSGYEYCSLLALENPLLFPDTIIYTKEDL